MADYARALTYPILAWLLLDNTNVLASYVFPATGRISVAGASSLVFLAIGIWGGYKIVEFKGNIASAIVAGLILGTVCAVLSYTARAFVALIAGAPAGDIGAAVYVFFLNLIGALLGGVVKK